MVSTYVKAAGLLQRRVYKRGGGYFLNLLRFEDTVSTK